MGKKNRFCGGVYVSDKYNAALKMKEPSEQVLQLSICSDPKGLHDVREQVERFVLDVGMGDEDCSNVVLAVDEALTNVIRHAYDGKPDQPIDITVVPMDGELSVIVRDYGKVADRSKIHSRDLDDVRPGGLGVHIMQQCMDSVEYLPAPEGGGTILVMTKNIQ
ncbi:MAG: ATP-binding protein [Phycisphaerae bacterium]|nr:ATP-binding protein [Phycisphaerae bacterium]